MILVGANNDQGYEQMYCMYSIRICIRICKSTAIATRSHQ